MEVLEDNVLSSKPCKQPKLEPFWLHGIEVSVAAFIWPRMEVQLNFFCSVRMGWELVSAYLTPWKLPMPPFGLLSLRYKGLWRKRPLPDRIAAPAFRLG